VPTEDSALRRGQGGFVCGLRLKRPWTRRTLVVRVGRFCYDATRRSGAYEYAFDEMESRDSRLKEREVSHDGEATTARVLQCSLVGSASSDAHVTIHDLALVTAPVPDTPESARKYSERDMSRPLYPTPRVL
jgi:hypothetical protein